MKYQFDCLNVITLLLIVFVVCLGAAFAQGQEAEPAVPFYRPVLDITPGHLVEGGNVTFVLHGYLPNGAYTLITPDEAQLVSNEGSDVTRVVLPFKVIQTSEAGIDALIEVKESITVSGLSSGLYEALVTINNGEAAQKKFHIAPEGTPAPIDYSEFRANIVLDPPHPKPDEEITFYITGEFPSAGFKVIDQRLDIMESLPEQIAVRMTVEAPSGPDAQVITPFRVMAGKAKLSEGAHPLIGTINEQVFFKGVFGVGRPSDPDPQPIIPGVELVIEPSNPKAGEEFTIFAQGVLPSPGYFIAEKSFYMTRSLPAHLVVNLLILPLEGILPHEDMPFKEKIGTAALPEGAHPVRGFMNDVLFYESRLVVGEDQSYSPTIYKFGLEVVPPNPAPGDAFDVYAVGIFPTPGYVITEKAIGIGESFPETVIVTLEVEAPTTAQPEVEEPFREFVGTASLEAGEHPILGSVNGETLYRSTLKVGEAPPSSEWITFQRSGGFAGWVQHLYVNHDRSASITSDAVIAEGNRSGLVPQDQFNRLRELLDGTDFAALEACYPNEISIADGYLYEITEGRDHTVLVEQEAMAPPELKDLVSVLESILDGRIDLDRRFNGETAISNWSMY